MKLKDWLRLNSKTQDGFAKELGITAACLHLWDKGTTAPPTKRLALIMALTGNQVAQADFSYRKRGWKGERPQPLDSRRGPLVGMTSLRRWMQFGIIQPDVSMRHDLYELRDAIERLPEATWARIAACRS